jgi:hypothetical protein
MSEEECSISPEELAQSYTPDNYELSHAWALGRENVDSDRTENVMFCLQDQVTELEEIAGTQIKNELGKEVSKTDLREAALILAYSQPKMLARLLSEWGAEYV